MKKIISLALEETMLILYLLWVGRHFSEIIETTHRLWVMGITTGIAIALSKVVEVSVDQRIRETINENHQLWDTKKQAICFCLISMVFFLSFCALEHFGRMPASTRLLIVLSVSTSFSHIVVGRLLDVLVELAERKVSKRYATQIKTNEEDGNEEEKKQK